MLMAAGKCSNQGLVNASGLSDHHSETTETCERSQPSVFTLTLQLLPGNVDSIIIGTLYENEDNMAVGNRQGATGVYGVL